MNDSNFLVKNCAKNSLLFDVKNFDWEIKIFDKCHNLYKEQ